MPDNFFILRLYINNSVHSIRYDKYILTRYLLREMGYPAYKLHLDHRTRKQMFMAANFMDIGDNRCKLPMCSIVLHKHSSVNVSSMLKRRWKHVNMR